MIHTTLTLQDLLTLKMILSLKITEQELRVAYYLEEPKTALLNQIDENKNLRNKLTLLIKDKAGS